MWSQSQGSYDVIILMLMKKSEDAIYISHSKARSDLGFLPPPYVSNK